MLEIGDDGSIAEELAMSENELVIQPADTREFYVRPQEEDIRHSLRKPVRQLDFSPLFELQKKPKKCKQCNCKNSRCLKLYCECFASGIYCEGCNCLNCWNNAENEKVRQEAVELTLERNPNAFRPKIGSNNPSRVPVEELIRAQLVVRKHNKGCHCKKSGCLKKYCECFQASVPCSDNCRCIECKNFSGSDERRAIFQAEQGDLGSLYASASSGSSGLLGCAPSSPTVAKKRRTQDLVFIGHALREQSKAAPQSSKAVKSFQDSYSVAISPQGSLLAGIVRRDTIRNLCKLLVIVSAEKARTFEAAKQKTKDEPCSCDDPWEITKPRGSHDDREPSPGTEALICDEVQQDTLLQQSSWSTNLLAEQERAVLAQFLDYLQGVITAGIHRGRA